MNDDYAALEAYTRQFRGDDYVETGEEYLMTTELLQFMKERYSHVLTDEYGFVRVTEVHNDDWTWVKGDSDVFETLVPVYLLRYRVINGIKRKPSE